MPRQKISGKYPDVKKKHQIAERRNIWFLHISLFDIFLSRLERELIHIRPEDAGFF